MERTLIFFTLIFSLLLISCKKERFSVVDHNVPDQCLEVANNFSKFLLEAYNSTEFSGSVSDAELFKLANDCIGELALSTKSNVGELSVLPAGDWILDLGHVGAVNDLSEIIRSANFKVDEYEPLCMDYIRRTIADESDRIPLFLFVETVIAAGRDFSFSTKSIPTPWEQFWLDLSTSVLGSIYGSAIAAMITDAGVGTAVGSGLGALIGAAAGLIIYYSADKVEVQGIVIDDHGDPVIGASVMAVGSSDGTVTNIDGIFRLKMPRGCSFVISYLGLKPVVVDTRHDGPIKIVMHEDNE